MTACPGGGSGGGGWRFGGVVQAGSGGRAGGLAEDGERQDRSLQRLSEVMVGALDSCFMTNLEPPTPTPLCV